MKRYLHAPFVLSLAVITAFTVLLCGCSRKSSEVVIAVNQFIDHPNLEATLRGFKQTMSAWGLKNGRPIRYVEQNANGKVDIATQIAQSQASANPDLILALATPSAQASVKATNRIPVVFGAITDPVEARLVTTLERPGGNATGTSDQWPYALQFDLIRKLLPQAKVVGFILNPGEANTVASMREIDRVLPVYGFSKVEAPVANTAEIVAATDSLVGRCDLLFAPADNTVLLGLDAVVRIAERRKVPLFVGDEGSVQKGGIATFGIDYVVLGQATGMIATRILDGEQPSRIPVAVGSAGRLVVNPEAAKRQGLIVPPDLLRDAKIVQ